MDPRRWTPLTFLAPTRYVDDDPFWASFDLLTWADREYEWVQDRWNGLRDFARRPHETVAAGAGDCEDFALVSISWAVAHGQPGVGLAFCFEKWRPWPTHVLAYDDTYVYSSGDIEERPVEDWLADSKYRFALRRRVTA